MSLRRIDYFDTLPIRRQPKRLESLTSYMIRLAEANGICKVNGLSTLFFKNFDTMRQVVAFVDFPLLSLQDMPAVARCSEAKLLAATFWHLGKKFGHSIRTLRDSQFLKGSLADCLRYCPKCLSKSSHYSLTWRFSTLIGCATHKCRLLEQCGHCGSRLPLFSSPLRMNTCSACHKDLRSCQAESRGENELRGIRNHMLDLEFLLSPQSCESDETLGRTVRNYLSMWRPRGFTLGTIAQIIGVEPGQIALANRGIVRGKSAQFQTYVKYANFVGAPLRQFFLQG